MFLILLLSAGVSIAMGALSHDRDLFDRDEAIYLRVTRLFTESVSLDLIKDYEGEPASPAPAFFLIYAGWGKLFGTSLPALRVLSLLFTIAATGLLWHHVRCSDRREDRFIFWALVFLFPYIFNMAFALMAEPSCLFFTVAALLTAMTALRNNQLWPLVFTALFSVIALYIRIHALFINAAVACVLIMQRDKDWRKWLCVLLPLVLRAAIIPLQGGLTVSRETFTATKPELGLCLSNINFFMIWYGLVFFPMIFQTGKYIRTKVTVTIVLLIFYFAFRPDILSNNHNGAIRTFLLLINIESFLLADLLVLPLWAVGCFMTLDLAEKTFFNNNIIDNFLTAGILLYMLELAMSSVAFERYYLLIVPSIILLGARKNLKPTGYLCWGLWHLLFLAFSFVRLAKTINTGTL